MYTTCASACAVLVAAMLGYGLLNVGFVIVLGCMLLCILLAFVTKEFA